LRFSLNLKQGRRRGYPEPDEIPELLRGYGMDELAARAGVNLSEVKIDFSVGGMRVTARPIMPDYSR
jgi:hypothetical protein